MHLHSSACLHIFFEKTKRLISPFIHNYKLNSRHSLGTRNNSKIIMDEFQQGHEMLREEVNHLKIQMGLVMEAL